MDDPTMCCQNFVVDYTIQERKRKGPVMYFEAENITDGAEPSDIMVLFPLLLL
jgi:hypothetical protein